MKFVYPWMLILLALVPVAGAFWVFLRARTEKRLNGLVAPALQARLMPRNPGLFNLQAALVLTGLALVAFAAARPQWGHSDQKMQAKSRNVVVALDVSRSMLAQDLRPNRLERAKADIADLIDELKSDRCALVAFRRTGALICPLTTDHAFLRSALEGASPESAARGETDLGAAIKTALDALDPGADDHNAIILISDGGDLRGNALAAAKAAGKRGVPVFTVGLGNPKSATTIPDASGSGNQRYQNQTVTTKLEEKALIAIAKASGGRYVPLATAGTAETTLGAIYRNFLRQVQQKEVAEEEELRATERFGLFLVPGLFLLLVAGCFSRGRFAGRGARTLAAATCLSFAFLASAETNQTNQAQSETNALATVEADKAYVAPKESRLSDREIWNQGYDYWKAGDTTNALETLRGLLLSRTHGARAAEVVGVLAHANRAAARNQSQEAAGVHAEGAALEPLKRAVAAGEESAKAMQIALRAAPTDPRANRNFTRAVTGLKELQNDLHVEEVLAAAKGKNPQEQMTAAAQEAQAIWRAQQGVLTNAAAVAVAESEALAVRAEKLADTLIPLKRQVLESITNEQQAATIVGDVEATRDATLKAAEQLADLSTDAAGSLAQVETAFHRYWKGVLDPPTALNEGFQAQTNVVAKAEPVNGRAWQQEALEFSQIFGAGFPQWVQQACGQDAAMASNQPPFTAEVAQGIATALADLAKKQSELAQKPNPAGEQEALACLTRMRERMGLVAGQPPQIIDYDILQQTNAYRDVQRTDGFDAQKDALDATRSFRAKFPAWAQQKAQQIEQQRQQGNTNVVAFTQEMQQEITTLAQAVEVAQQKMVKTPLPPEQEEILRKLARIRELLPKDNNGGGQNNQQQQQQQQQDQQQQQQDQQKNDQDQQEEQKQEQKQEQAKEQPKDQKDVEDLLRKAQERNDEHENDKKARMRRQPLAPNDRDW